MPKSQAILTAEKMADEKLKRIIEREGDANGARLEPEYWLQLFREAVRTIATEEQFGIKKEQLAS